jgi:FecR protein
VIHTRGESFDAREGAAAIAVEPDSGVVIIPDTHFLCTADFKRKGPDLVLTGEDGRKILVPDYFRQEKQPDLVSPEGAILSASVIELLAGTAAPGQYAQAGAPAAQQPIGRVETVAGSATAVRNGVAVELNVGDLVFQGDVVQTLSNATLAIAFSDGSAFTLQENARLALNEFVYDPNSTANSALISLVQGTVSFVAAQVAKTGNMRVDTPTATLGIRGTFITLSVSSTDGHTVASLGLETNPLTGQQFAGVFTLTNRITGNQVTVNQVNSMFSVSPAGTMSESPKPPGIHALEQATFQALVPIMAAAANLGAIGPGQGQNQNLNQNLNQAPDQKPGQGPDQKSGQPQGPSGAPTNSGPVGSSQGDPLNKEVPNSPIGTTAPPTPTQIVSLVPTQTPPNSPSVTNPNPAPIPPVTPPAPHITPTGTTTDVTDTQTASAQSGFSIMAHVSVANPGSPTAYVSGSAQLASATYPGGLPGALISPAFLSSLLSIDPDGIVRYDATKFNFLAAGQSLSYTIAFDVASGPIRFISR